MSNCKKRSRDDAPCYIELIGARNSGLEITNLGIPVRRFRYVESIDGNQNDRQWHELSMELIALARTDHSTFKVLLPEGTQHVQTSLQGLAALHADYPHSGSERNQRAHLEQIQERLRNFLSFRASVYKIVEPPSTIRIDEGRIA